MVYKSDQCEDSVTVPDEAQRLAVSGDYAGAIALLEAYLRCQLDIPTKRFLANVYELRALDLVETKQGSLTISPDFQRAQQILQEILKDHPHDIITLCDLGDHFLNLRAIDQAVSNYRAAAAAIKQAEDPKSWRDETADAINKIGDGIKRAANERDRSALRQARDKITNAINGT